MELALRVFRHQEYQEVVKAGDVHSDELGDLVCRCIDLDCFDSLQSDFGTIE